MGKLDSRGGLSVAEVVFYAPALLLGIVVCAKHGFSKTAGWLYLCLLPLLRLIGASVTLYIVTQNDYSAELLETAAVTSAIGTTPLLLVLMGLMERLHAQLQLQQRGFSSRLFRPIHLIALIALVLGIVGGVEQGKSSSNSAQIGKDCTEAASILFLAVYVALAAITFLTVPQHSAIPIAERKLLIASVCVLPFVLVRIIYTVASAFSSPGSIFNSRSPNVYVQAFMLFTMEAIAIILYIWAGLLTPKATPIPKRDVEMSGDGPRKPYARGQEGAY